MKLFSFFKNESLASVSAYGYFISLFSIFILPDFNVVDLVGSNLLYLTIFNFLGLLSLFIFFDKEQFDVVLKSKLNLIFVSFIAVSLVSFLFAYNLNESVVKFSFWINIYFSFILSSYFFKYSSVKFISYLVLIFVTINIFLIYSEYFTMIENVQYSFNLSSYLRGLTGNKNIVSSVLLLSYFFLFYITSLTKNNYSKFFLWILSFLIFYAILALSSRSVFIATFFCIFIFCSYLVFLKLKSAYTNFFKARFRLILIFFFLPLLLSYFFFNTLSVNSTDVNFSDRIVSVNTSDQSTSTRLRYYELALNQISSSPFIGVGIGNWKFKSIDYDKLNVRQYIIPYHVHNDFLEIFTELGLFGFLAYLFLFIYCFFKLIKHIFWSSNHIGSIVFLFVLSAYFIDSNLNFPHARLTQQIFFILTLSYVVNLKSKSDE